MTTLNPYTARLRERGMTRFRRAQYKQRERGFSDYLDAKDIMAYYEAPLKIAPEVGRANYNMGWRVARDSHAEEAKRPAKKAVDMSANVR
jgi:hypothetical protein